MSFGSSETYDGLDESSERVLSNPHSFFLCGTYDDAVESIVLTQEKFKFFYAKRALFSQISNRDGSQRFLQSPDISGGVGKDRE